MTFDQLLLSLRDVASFCLRSLLIALNDWRKRFIKQIKTSQRGPFMSSRYMYVVKLHCIIIVYTVQYMYIVHVVLKKCSLHVLYIHVYVQYVERTIIIPILIT